MDGVLWDRSRARPVGETARRSVGNRKERQDDATMRVPRVRRRPVDAEKPTGNARERILQNLQAGVFFICPRQTPGSENCRELICLLLRLLF